MSNRAHLAYLSKRESYFHTERPEMLEFVPLDARRVAEFGCAVFLDVLDHLRSPWDVLTELKSYLAPGGSVIASIPNLRHFEVMKSLLLKKRFEYQDEGVLDRTHLRFFTRDDILQLFATTGFTVSRITGLKGRFPWKFSLLNKLTGGALSDMQFLQFAVVAAWTP